MGLEETLGFLNYWIMNDQNVLIMKLKDANHAIMRFENYMMQKGKDEMSPKSKRLKENDANLKQFRIENAERIQSYFNEYAHMSDQKITILDYLLFLRECFHGNSGYVLVEKKGSMEEFFAKPNIYSLLYKAIQSYYQREKHIGIESE